MLFVDWIIVCPSSLTIESLKSDCEIKIHLNQSLKNYQTGGFSHYAYTTAPLTSRSFLLLSVIANDGQVRMHTICQICMNT